MSDVPPKLKRRSWLIVLLLSAAVLLIGSNYAFQRSRLRNWARGVQERGLTPYIVSELSDIDPEPMMNRVRMLLSGWKCVMVIESEDQVNTLIDAGDSPLRLDLKIKPGVPAEAAQRLQERFPTADIEGNSSTGTRNIR